MFSSHIGSPVVPKLVLRSTANHLDALWNVTFSFILNNGGAIKPELTSSLGFSPAIELTPSFELDSAHRDFYIGCEGISRFEH
jgi:hypothetical protein